MTHLRWSGKTLWDFYLVKSDLWEWWRSNRNGGSSPLPSYPFPFFLHPDIPNFSAGTQIFDIRHRTAQWQTQEHFFWKLKCCNWKRCEGSSVLSPCVTPLCSSCHFGTHGKANCCCEIRVLGYQKYRNKVVTVLSCPHPKKQCFILGSKGECDFGFGS